MARRYDTRTTIFSPEGRLYQVEYAMEAISHAGTCLGIVAKDGVLLAAQRLNTDKLLDTRAFSDKIHKLNEDNVCAVAGVTADANLLIDELRVIAQRHQGSYGESIPCETLVCAIADIKQTYTQMGGRRPFGVSFLYAGWDTHYQFQLYQSDPSGNYSGWKATCIGHNCADAASMLNDELDVDNMPNLRQAQDLAIKILTKTLDSVKLTSDNIEMATLKRRNDKTIIKNLTKQQVHSLIEKYEKIEAAEEATEEAAEEAAEEATEEGSEEAAEEGSEEAPEEGSEEAPEEGSEEGAEEAAEKVVEDPLD